VLDSATGITSETLANRQSLQVVWEQWETFMAALDGPPGCIHDWQLVARDERLEVDCSLWNGRFMKHRSE
jgi:uncharacterized protein (DUF1778 family)